MTDQAAAIREQFVRKHSIWATRAFRFRHPTLSATLYGRGYEYLLAVDGPVNDFAKLAQDFHDNIRPITCPITLVQQTPAALPLVETKGDLEAELWLTDAPLSELDINRNLCLAVPGLPEGRLRLDPTTMVWRFVSAQILPGEQKAKVLGGFSQLKLPGEPIFVVEAPMPPKPAVKGLPPPDKLNLITSSRAGDFPAPICRLIEADEAEWRSFLQARVTALADGPIPSAAPTEFACLFDATDESDVELSELLTIYDRVDLMPRSSLQPFGQLKTDLAEIAELAHMGRIRLILPMSVEHYEPKLIEAVVEANPEAIVLSRALAARTIEKGEKKNPLLYAPFNAEQRALLLNTLLRASGEQNPIRPFLLGYAPIFEGQASAFMERGANGHLGFGVGRYLGDIIKTLHNHDSVLEFCIAGAHVEWGMGLGASYMPPTIGKSAFSLHHHCSVIASYLGRTTHVPSDPATNRMHTVVDGLLSVSDVPALEIAKNFNGNALRRFRETARRLMQSSPSAEEVALVVDQLNAEVRKFESNKKRLKHWGIGALALKSGEMGIHGAAEHAGGPFAALAVLWLLEMMGEWIPARAREELTSIADFTKGLLLSPSMDAVIVSRSRKQIHSSASDE